MHAIEYTNLILEIPRESWTIVAINIYVCVCVSGGKIITCFKASQLLVKDCKLGTLGHRTVMGFF